MMYGSCYFNLQMALPREERARLAASIRRYRMVKAVSVTEKRVQIWYRGTLPIREIQRLAIATVTRAKEAAVTPAERLAEYRRDALFSLASFAGMEVLKRTSPQLFLSVKVVRSLLVLAIARKFIKNGVQGMVKDHQPNADTLTATAVIASVLAGKPESSLTLLAISNGAEMLTSYAAERARSHISGLLSMDQRYVWLVDGETERKVPIEQVKAGDIIAAHTGEKIVIDGHVLRGDAAINQASITGESNPAMKHKGSPVYAGSVVEAGELVVAVEKVGKDTSLAHIVHLVEEAQTRKAPVQNFADQMANFLVPLSFTAQRGIGSACSTCCSSISRAASSSRRLRPFRRPSAQRLSAASSSRAATTSRLSLRRIRSCSTRRAR